MDPTELGIYDSQESSNCIKEIYVMIHENDIACGQHLMNLFSSLVIPLPSVFKILTD